MAKDLSMDIINKFAKVITQNQKVKKQTDTEIYGTIVESNGTKFVRLDGSELLTPMVETMDCESGDRVTVKISNHKALVMGNISNPASNKVATNFAKIIDGGLMIGHLEAGNPVGTYVVLKQDEYLILAEDGTVLASFSADRSRLQTNDSSLVLTGDQLNLNGPDGTKFYINGKETTGGGETIPVANATTPGLLSSDLFVKLNELPNRKDLDDIYARKSEISGVYRFKGSVKSESELPETGMEEGDVYKITSESSYGPAGTKVAWVRETINGGRVSYWDALGGSFTVNTISMARLEEILV